VDDDRRWRIGVGGGFGGAVGFRDCILNGGKGGDFAFCFG
jgi:hypothetical protein